MKINRSKKTLSMLLAVMMVIGMLPMTTFATTTQIVDEGGTKYYKNGGEVLVNPALGTNSDVSVSKTISNVMSGGNKVENEFEITLEVKTTVDVTELNIVEDVATVLVFDVSGSMTYCADCGRDPRGKYTDVKGHTANCQYHKDHPELTVDSNRVYTKDADKTTFYKNGTRIAKAVDAAVNFLDRYAASANGAKRLISVVTFNSENSGTVKQNWIDISTAQGLATAKTAIQNLLNTDYYNNGTYMEYGLEKARDQFGTDSGDPFANYKSITNCNVIVLSDGAQSSSNTPAETRAAEVKATSYKVSNKTHYKNAATIYAIAYAEADMSWLQTKIASSSDCVFSASDADALEIAFDKISRKIEISAEAWTVTDPMGDNIINWAPSTGYKEDKAKGTFFDTDENTFIWNLLKGDRTQSGSTYVYTFKYRVTLDNTASGFKFSDSVSTNKYLTNGETTLNYVVKTVETVGDQTVTGVSQNYIVPFKVPSVIGFAAPLRFTKVSSLGGTVLAGAVFELYRNGTKIDTKTSDANGVVNFGNLPSGHTYTLKETTAPTGHNPIADIEFKVSYGKLVKGSTEWENPIKIVNQVQKNPMSVNINLTKAITGTKLHMSGTEFTFNVYDTPDCSGAVLGTGTYTTIANVESGNVTITFDYDFASGGEAVDFYVKEVTGNAAGWTYDDSVLKFTATTTAGAPAYNTIAAVADTATGNKFENDYTPATSYTVGKTVYSVSGTIVTDQAYKPNAKAGDEIVFAVTVTNTGVLAMSNYTVTDTLAGVTGPFAQPTDATTTDWSKPIAAGASATRYYKYTVPAGVTADQITNSVTVTNVVYEDGSTGDNLEGSTQVPVVYPVMSVKKEVMDISGNYQDANSAETAVELGGGSTVTFKITVTNSGTAPGTVTLTDIVTGLSNVVVESTIDLSNLPTGEITVNPGYPQSFYVTAQLKTNEYDPIVMPQMPDGFEAATTAYESALNAFRTAETNYNQALLDLETAISEFDGLNTPPAAYSGEFNIDTLNGLADLVRSAQNAYDEAVAAYANITPIPGTPAVMGEDGVTVITPATDDETDEAFQARLNAAYGAVETAYGALEGAKANYDAYNAGAQGYNDYITELNTYNSNRTAALGGFQSDASTTLAALNSATSVLNDAIAALDGFDAALLAQITAALEAKANVVYLEGSNTASISGNNVDTGSDDAYIKITPVTKSSISAVKLVGASQNGPFASSLVIGENATEVWYKLRIINNGYNAEKVYIADTFNSVPVDLTHASILYDNDGYYVEVQAGTVWELVYSVDVPTVDDNTQYTESKVYQNCFTVKHIPADGSNEGKLVENTITIPVIVQPKSYANVSIVKEVLTATEPDDVWQNGATVASNDAQQFLYRITLTNTGTANALVTLEDDQATAIYTDRAATNLYDGSVITVPAGEPVYFYAVGTTPAGGEVVNVASFEYTENSAVAPFNEDGGSDTAVTKVEPIPVARITVEKTALGSDVIYSDTEVTVVFEIKVSNHGLAAGKVKLTDILTHVAGGTSEPLTTLYTTRAAALDALAGKPLLSTSAIFTIGSTLTVEPQSFTTLYYAMNIGPFDNGEAIVANTYTNTVTVVSDDKDTIVDKSEDDATVTVVPMGVANLVIKKYVKDANGVWQDASAAFEVAYGGSTDVDFRIVVELQNYEGPYSIYGSINDSLLETQIPFAISYPITAERGESFVYEYTLSDLAAGTYLNTATIDTAELDATLDGQTNLNVGPADSAEAVITSQNEPGPGPGPGPNIEDPDPTPTPTQTGGGGDGETVDVEPPVVPLAPFEEPKVDDALPPEEIIIEDELPLSDIPNTGDTSTIAPLLFGMGGSLAGIMALLRGKKKED